MDLQGVLEPTVVGLGYELVDLEVSNRGRLIRIFIDKPEGVNIDDCALVSNQISRVLAVELDFDYDRLEVSSPGLDRVLKKEADFSRFVGHNVQVKVRIPIGARKNFMGRLLSVADGVLGLDVDGVSVAIEIANLDKARLVPNF